VYSELTLFYTQKLTLNSCSLAKSSYPESNLLRTNNFLRRHSTRHYRWCFWRRTMGSQRYSI